ncbi:TIGR02117 family protein [Flavobacterium sp. JP2137]|uniref:TIGR02117 family protein n=1 Tax=Flavobacterium sp. JP2137 TaxID=3414510 RepID=UPI003D2FF3A6
MSSGIKVWVILGKLILGFLAFVALYLLAELLLSRITVGGNSSDSEAKEVEIYLYSNGVHTDIVLPLRHELKDWSVEIDPMDTKAQPTDMRWIAMGWGDKGFYLETPEWSDLKASVAFKAAFYLGSSAVHTTFYRSVQEGEKCVKVSITRNQYRALIAYIENSFDRNAAGEVLLIKSSTYGNTDSFYEAKRTYGLFYTCNTWANNALKAAGLPACLWTASDRGILYQYRHLMVKTP